MLTQQQQEQAALNNYNFDHPDAFDFDLIVATLQKLKQGKSVKVPVYDFTTHSRKKDWVGPTGSGCEGRPDMQAGGRASHGSCSLQKTLYGANVIIFEGIMAFADKTLLEVRAGSRLAILLGTSAGLLGPPRSPCARAPVLWGTVPGCPVKNGPSLYPLRPKGRPEATELELRPGERCCLQHPTAPSGATCCVPNVGPDPRLIRPQPRCDRASSEATESAVARKRVRLHLRPKPHGEPPGPRPLGSLGGGSWALYLPRQRCCPAAPGHEDLRGHGL